MMTTEEIQEFIANLGSTLGAKIAEVAELQKRNEEEQRETGRQLKETDRQLKETDRYLKETDRELKESSKAVDRQLQATDRQLKELGRQLGGLGDKFGSFTEGMALPSMARLLHDRFRMDVVSPRILSRNNGRSMELDVLAVSRKPEVDEAYVVEIKSHLREDGLTQMKKILRDVRDFFPYLADKKIYGILAVVDAPEKLRQKVLQEGIYLARIHDEEFELEVPADFRPRAF
jgi:hypothetical protein